MNKSDQAEIYSKISLLLLAISKGQQIQQCIKEVMTTHSLFHPLALFKYISKNTATIKKEHLLQFFIENNQSCNQKEIEMVLLQLGGKRTWQYSNFLKAVYPFNSAALREITNLHLKKYQQLHRHKANQSAVTSFLILLSSKIQLHRKVQRQREEYFANVSKEKLKQILSSIKEAKKRMCEREKTRITSLQFINFIKENISLQEHLILHLLRKLKVKNGQFFTDSLYILLKPKKGKSNQSKILQNQPIIANKDKLLREMQYRESLNQSLSKELHLNTSIKQHRLSLKGNNDSTSKKTANEKHSAQARKQLKYQSIPKYIAYNEQNNKQNSIKISLQKLFIQYIKALLPAAKQLQKLKLQVAVQRIDLLAVFKNIDRSQRGIATADDLYHYSQTRGLKQFLPQHFQLLINSYRSSDDPWLNFSEFYTMLKAEEKQPANNSEIKYKNEEELIIKIIQLSIKSSINSARIRKHFQPNQVLHLFNYINEQSTGFINYQELKKFITQQGLLLTMNDLMTVLKRFDKSKNGVITQQEFLSHFEPYQVN